MFFMSHSTIPTSELSHDRRFSVPVSNKTSINDAHKTSLFENTMFIYDGTRGETELGNRQIGLLFCKTSEFIILKTDFRCSR